MSSVPTSFTWTQWGNHICIAGSFDPPTPVWQPIEMPKNTDNVNQVTLDLIPNKKYYYKFVIDGNWVLDPSKASFPDESGNHNHEILVEPPPPPPPIPSEEEVTVECQQEHKEQEEHQDEEQVITEHCQEDKVITNDNQEEHCQDNQVVAEEQKEENQEEKVEDHNQENQVVDKDEQVVTDDKKEHYQHDEEQVTTDDQKEQHKEEPVLTDDKKEHYHHEEEHVAIDDQKEHHQNKEEQIVTDDQKEHKEEEPVLTDDKKEHYNHEEEQIATDDQKEQQQNEEEQVITEDQKEQHTHEDYSPKDDVIPEEHPSKDEIETDDKKERYNHEEEQVATDDQKEQQQNEEEQVVTEDQKEQIVTDDNKKHYNHEEEQIATDDQKEQQNEEEQVVIEDQKEQHTHEDDSPKDEVIPEEHPSKDEIVTDDKKEHYNHEEEQIATDDQKEQQNEEEQVVIEDQKEQHKDEDYPPKDEVVTEEVAETSVVHTEQSRNDSVITEEICVSTLEPQTVTTVVQETIPDLIESPSSIVKEVIIESDDEKLSAEHVANTESIIEKTHDIVVDEETPKESQYTSSILDEDSMTTEFNDTSIKPVTTVENIEEINKINTTDEQTNEEMTSSNHEGISSIITTTQETIDTEITVPKEMKEEVSEVNVDELTKEVKLGEEIVDDSKEPIIEQSIVVDEDSNNESKVTEFIEEKSSTTDVDSEIKDYSTETTMPSSEMNYEDDYQPELDPINENEDEDEYEDDNEHNKVDKNEYTNVVESIINPEGVSPETIKEVLLNHTWAKDESMEEYIPSSWLESYESTGYVWSENTQLDWDKESNQEQNTSTRKVEEDGGTWPSEETNDEIESREIPPAEKTITEQAEEIPYTTSMDENLESTLTEESNGEYEKKIIVEETVEEKPKEFDETGERLIIKENIISTSEVKMEAVAEPSSVSTVQYEKPESSATADEKISSMPTTVVAPANEQENMFNPEDVIKMIGKQENFEETQSISAGVNIPAGKISQRNIISISPNASSPGESTRNADMYTHNINVATNTSREILSETINTKSKYKKPPIEISTSREVMHKDQKYVREYHAHVEKIDFSLVYLVTSVTTTFALGIISMLYTSVFGTKRNR